MNVTITTAIALTAKQLETLEKAIDKKFGKGTVIKEVVDPQVVGGIKIHVGTWEYDATLKSKLSKVRHQLLAHV